MMPPKKRGAARTVLLPWERKRALLSELFSARRWRATLALLLAGGFLMWSLDRASERANVRTTRAALAEAQRAVAAFRTQVGRCPRSLVELVHPPKSGARYLTETPVDGWGHELLVQCPARRDPTSAEVISAGPSGSFLVDDNIY